MKLNQPGTYGQRQQPWASQLLGYNSNPQYTIGNYGCLITCFGNYLGKNPSEINELLKANSGFASGGNFIWSKAVVLGLTQTYLSPRYSSLVTIQGLQKIKELLDQGLPLICEIDFNPATTGEEMHYILVNSYEGDTVGAFDPWTAQQINLDIYGGPARAIIQFRAYSKKLPTVAIQPPTGQNLQPMRQIIVDAYQAICQVNPTEDEIQNRLNTQINTLDLIKDLLNNDSRSPLSALKQQINRLNELNNQQLQLIIDLQKQLSILLSDQANILLNQVRVILWGKGWWWTKINNLKKLLPR